MKRFCFIYVAIGGLLISTGCNKCIDPYGNPCKHLFSEDTNRRHLSDLRVGMTKIEVLDMMGEGECINNLVDITINPEKTEVIELDDVVYEVFYFRTEYSVTAEYKKDSLDKLWDRLFPPQDWFPGPIDSVKSYDEWCRTPLIFKDDILVGWGRTYWRQRCPAYKARFIQDPNEPIEWEKQQEESRKNYTPPIQIFFPTTKY